MTIEFLAEELKSLHGRPKNLGRNIKLALQVVLLRNRAIKGKPRHSDFRIARFTFRSVLNGVSQ